MNRATAQRLAEYWGKAIVAGSDAHTPSPLGRTYTQIAGARDKAEFLESLRQGRASAHGESGGLLKLTRAVAGIGLSLLREKRWTLMLSPLFLAIPLVTIGNSIAEELFSRHWAKRTLADLAADRRGGRELEPSQIKP